MKLVVQRVKTAKVDIAGEIGAGLFVLVGIKRGDTKEQAKVLAEKLVKLRVMADAEDKMNLPAENFLIVSQFTLYADTSGGNRPSFIKAALPADAKEIYEHFVTKLRELGAKVATGSFGNYMKIDAVLDGPVTIVLEG